MARRKAVVPHVVGLDVDDARKLLAIEGFTNVMVRYSESYAADFEVVEQQPNGGQMVASSSEVVVEVARQSLRHFLPQIYSKMAEAGSFLQGFLYIVQYMHDTVERRLDRVHELFDPRTTDSEFLPWLANWLAISLNRDWGELRARKMLLAAMELFPYRGTAYAIERFVQIYTDAEVRVEENVWPFKGFRIGVHSTVGVDTVILPPMNLSHCFVVHLKRSVSEVPNAEVIRIHEIIQLQKPAHTTYFLSFADESDGGEMGTFMTIGGGAIGVGVGGEIRDAEATSTASEDAASLESDTRAEASVSTKRATVSRDAKSRSQKAAPATNKSASKPASKKSDATPKAKASPKKTSSAAASKAKASAKKSSSAAAPKAKASAKKSSSAAAPKAKASAKKASSAAAPKAKASTKKSSSAAAPKAKTSAKKSSSAPKKSTGSAKKKKPTGTKTTKK